MANDLSGVLATTVGPAHSAWAREARGAMEAAARRGLFLRDEELVWLDVRDLQGIQCHLLGGDETAEARRRARAVLKIVALSERARAAYASQQ
jgi:hypothetical protein